MEQKIFPLQNRGMNRDGSISKADNSSAFENWNVRITARDHDTLLSVTNERGNKEISVSGQIKGQLIGWNVLNKHLILFTTSSPAGAYTGDHVPGSNPYHYKATFYSIPGNGWRIVELYVPVSLDSDQWTKVGEFIVPSNINPTLDDVKDAINDQLLDAEITGYKLETTTINSVPYLVISATEQAYENIVPRARMTAKVLVYSPAVDTTVELVDYPQFGGIVPIEGPDYIYRIDFDDGGAYMRRGNTDTGAEDGEVGVPLYEGKLRFDVLNPIESVVYYESDEIQKIYWVDGFNVLRFMNFMESTEFIDANWNSSDSHGFGTYFDSNRIARQGLSVGIEKNNTGNSRANGVAQYLITYYNKHGQQSGYVWASDLVYLSPLDSGGSPDGKNNNSITLSISGLDTSYDYFRVYSIERSSLNGTIVGYLIAENKINSTGESVVVDSGNPLSTIDASSLLYLGSQAVVAGTLTHKDQTLFLGDLSSVGRKGYAALQNAINCFAFEENEGDASPTELVDDNVYLSHIVHFELSDGTDDKTDINHPINYGAYPYENQLIYSSSEITTFKGGEKYRFALMFRSPNGINSDAFWIGDKVNHLYPVLDDNVIHRVVAVCDIPQEIIDEAKNAGFTVVSLMIAEANYSTRSVLAQGIINPTMFNVWERFNNRTYSYSSWLFRPRHSKYAWKHFMPVRNSNNPFGEIQCNYWTSDEPTPYYREWISPSADAGKVVDELDGIPDYNVMAIVYYVACVHKFGWVDAYKGGVTIIRIKFLGDLTEQIFKNNSGLTPATMIDNLDKDGIGSFVYNSTTYKYKAEIVRKRFDSDGTGNPSRKSLWSRLHNFMAYEEGISETIIPTQTTIDTWTDGNYLHKRDGDVWKLLSDTTDKTKKSERAALTALTMNGLVSYALNISSTDNDYLTAYYKKHVMFVDENVVTFNSPEIEQEAINIDKSDLKFRVIGVAPISGNITDYTLFAGPARLAGSNLYQLNFSKNNPSESADGLVSWPLYLENIPAEASASESYVPDNIKDRTDSSYNWGDGIGQYWLHMWQKGGTIQDFSDDDGVKYSELKQKIFANLRFSHCSYFDIDPENQVIFTPYENGGSVRQFNYTNEQLVGIKAFGKEVSYSANVNEGLSTPSSHKYPILYSSVGNSDVDSYPGTDYKKMSASPVVLQYHSTPHVVISLGETDNDESILLPYIYDSVPPDSDEGEVFVVDDLSHLDMSDGYIPWLKDDTETQNINEQVVRTSQAEFDFYGKGTILNNGDRYLLIGELYKDFDEDVDYGGHSSSVINSTKFITAGRNYDITSASSGLEIIGNQGDTYYQRWDCLKTVPYSTDALNSVIDIVSFMVETHINIDGRYDKQRGISLLASINTEQFNNINPVYSQDNNFFAAFDQDSDSDLDTYRSSITWTLPKADAADIDEWTHITLASSLKLDGDKGICRALRRFNNTIFAFQDRGIAEVLFNSRTQIPSSEGVPIEIANSGKVDGKRYISNKYGCINKWSIVEGKAGLYFVDNTNKMFGRLDQGITDLSTKLSFNAWFRKINNMEPWNPDDFNNIVSFYDRVHSDVYLISSEDGSVGAPLVYNEILDAFTGFFDYWDVPMMTNIEDSFISFKNHKLWLQNSGLYCNFFGTQYDFSVTYRVTPDPYGDKIWTNLDYRADFFQTVTADGSAGLDYNADQLIMWNGEEYQPNMTFDYLRVWNEYQSTQTLKVADIAKDQYADTRKKFRIWRMDIPRAVATATNKYGLDRIRNPWIFLQLKKNMSSGNANRCLMQLHDVNVKYFE